MISVTRSRAKNMKKFHISNLVFNLKKKKPRSETIVKKVAKEMTIEENIFNLTDKIFNKR